MHRFEPWDGLRDHLGSQHTIMAIIATQFLPKDVSNRKDLDVRTGDTVKVSVKIEEKGKTRIQMFEGLVIARKHGAESGGTISNT
jgi:ribosomal protein L19